MGLQSWVNFENVFDNWIFEKSRVVIFENENFGNPKFQIFQDFEKSQNIRFFLISKICVFRKCMQNVVNFETT